MRIIIKNKEIEEAIQATSYKRVDIMERLEFLYREISAFKDSIENANTEYYLGDILNLIKLIHKNI